MNHLSHPIGIANLVPSYHRDRADVPLVERFERDHFATANSFDERRVAVRGHLHPVAVAHMIIVADCRTRVNDR